MKLFKWGKKVQDATKNVGFKQYFPMLPDFNGFLGGGVNTVPITQAFIFYQTVSPFYHAVNKIATEIANIKPFIVDIKSGKTIDDHPLMKLLNNPNSSVTYYEFAKRAITHLLVAGNLYLRVKALNENAPPVYLDAVDPRSITLTQASTIDQYPWQYNIVFTNETESFIRNTATDFHYYNPSKTQELCQIKDFCSTADGLLGMPRTAPLNFDLLQFAYASQYNLAVLANGGRLSTVFMNKSADNVSPDQLERLRQESRSALSGPTNNGRQLVLDGDWDVKELGVTNKDMDFLKQKEHVSQNIYSLYEIPLPLVMSSTMTMGNYETAITTFYDNAVIPTITFFFQRLSAFLLRRYKNSENLKITYDPYDITALTSRRLDQLDKRRQIGVESMNEIRTEMNLNPLISGGDVIYQNSNMVATGATEDLKTSDEFQTLVNERRNNPLDKLSHFKNSEGKPLFTDDEIAAIKGKA